MNDEGISTSAVLISMFYCSAVQLFLFLEIFWHTHHEKLICIDEIPSCPFSPRVA